MALSLISGVRTLTDDAKPAFPGQSGLGIKWVTLKARTNGFTLLSNIEESDGFRVHVGSSIDFPVGLFNFNDLFWRNTVTGDNCVVEIIGQREVVYYG